MSQAPTTVGTQIARALGNLLLRKRHVIQRCAAAVAIICGLLIAFKLARLSVWDLIGLDLLVRSTFWPSIMLEAALVVCLFTSDWFWRTVQQVRSSWTKAQQFMLLALCLNCCAAVNCLVNYPELLSNNYHIATLNERQHLRNIRGYRSVPIENLAVICCRQTPKNAHILYHGTHEGWIFAYEVYPRRVYMLPTDSSKLSASWHLKRWLHNLWPDPLEKYWDRKVTMTEAEREDFIQEHKITHEVFYDAAHPEQCRCEVLR
jgi:hypothetical protein